MLSLSVAYRFTPRAFRTDKQGRPKPLLDDAERASEVAEGQGKVAMFTSPFFSPNAPLNAALAPEANAAFVAAFDLTLSKYEPAIVEIVRSDSDFRDKSVRKAERTVAARTDPRVLDVFPWLYLAHAEKAEEAGKVAMFQTSWFKQIGYAAMYNCTDEDDMFMINGGQSEDAMRAFISTFDRTIHPSLLKRLFVSEYRAECIAKAKRSIVRVAPLLRPGKAVWAEPLAWEAETVEIAERAAAQAAAQDAANPCKISRDEFLEGTYYPYHAPQARVAAREMFHPDPEVCAFFRTFDAIHPTAMAFTGTPKGTMRFAWKALAGNKQLNSKGSDFPCRILEFLVNFNNPVQVLMPNLRRYKLIGAGGNTDADDVPALVLKASRQGDEFHQGVGFLSNLVKQHHWYYPEVHAVAPIGRFNVVLALDWSIFPFSDEAEEIMRWSLQPSNYLHPNAVRNFARLFGEHQLRIGAFVSALATGETHFLSQMPPDLVSTFAMKELALLGIVMHCEELGHGLNGGHGLPFSLNQESVVLNVARALSMRHFEVNGLNALSNATAEGDWVPEVDKFFHRCIYTLISALAEGDISFLGKVELAKIFVETCNFNEPNDIPACFENNREVLDAVVDTVFQGDLAQLKVYVLEAVLKVSNTPVCTQVRYQVLARMVRTPTFPLTRLTPRSYANVPDLFNAWFELTATPQPVEVLRRFSLLVQPVLSAWPEFARLIDAKIAEVESAGGALSQAEPLPVALSTPRSKRFASAPPDIEETHDAFKRAKPQVIVVDDDE